MSDTNAKQVRSLIAASGDEQTAVGATLDYKLFARSILVVDQVLAGRDKVIEHILLVQQATTIMPFLAVFTRKCEC